MSDLEGKARDVVKINTTWLDHHNETNPTSEQECASLVFKWKDSLRHSETANGVTFSHITSECFAEFGVTGHDYRMNFSSCVFYGKLLFPFYYIKNMIYK